MKKTRKFHLLFGIITVFAIMAMIFALDKPIKNGYSVFDAQGCCDAICQQTSKEDCYGNFYAKKSCDSLDVCNMGCCVDPQGYCLSNYLAGNCEKKGGEFVSSMECKQYPKCNIKDNKSILGDIGYSKVYGKNGLLYSEPATGIKGDIFTIKLYSFRKKLTPTVHIKMDKYEKSLNLFDDGKHNDGKANDAIYAANWDSSVLPDSNTIKNIQLILEEDAETKNNIVLGLQNCIPLAGRSGVQISGKNIIFAYSGSVSGSNSDSATFTSQANAIAAQIMQISYGSVDFNQMNFFMMDENTKSSDVNTVKRIIANKCKFYDYTKDEIIFLDHNYDSCENKNKIIKTTATMMFDRKKLTKVKNYENFSGSFCELILTENTLKESLGFLFYPNMSVENPTKDAQFNENNVSFEFKIENKKDPITNYSIYLDSYSDAGIIESGKAKSNEMHASNIFVSDGFHRFWVEAEDRDGNWVRSVETNFLVNSSWFTVNIVSLTNYSYQRSPEIAFVITNEKNNNITYSVLADNLEIASDNIRKNELIKIPTNLARGDHTIQITAQDAEGRFAKSIPIEIYVAMYSAQNQNIENPQNQENQEVQQ